MLNYSLKLICLYFLNIYHINAIILSESQNPWRLNAQIHLYFLSLEKGNQLRSHLLRLFLALCSVYCSPCSRVEAVRAKHFNSHVLSPSVCVYLSLFGINVVVYRLRCLHQRTTLVHLWKWHKKEKGSSKKWNLLLKIGHQSRMNYH